MFRDGGEEVLKFCALVFEGGEDIIAGNERNIALSGRWIVGDVGSWHGLLVCVINVNKRC